MKKYSRLLQKYAQVMLPPALEKGVEMPLLPFSKAPDVESIQQEQLKRVEEMEKAKGEGEESNALKMKHIDEMLKALDEGGEDAFFGNMKVDDTEYAADVILPPAPGKLEISDEEDKEFHKALRPGHISPFWNRILNEQLGESSIQENDEDILKKLQEGNMAEKHLGSPISSEQNTVPPGKASSADRLLNKCAFYYNLCCK